MDDHDEVTITGGSYHDYLALERFHYRAAAPATRVRVLSARSYGMLAGVLVVSMPTLNGRWRDLAWPGERPGDRRESARWINRELRCVSRVIVEPRFRGQSIARRLVQEYLRSPDSPRTEAIAAMGAFCPFFQAAGMREVRPGRTARDQALARALARAGLSALECVDVARAQSVIARSPRLAREIERWARSSRATSRRCGGKRVGLPRLAELACLGGSAIAQPPRVFVWP
jgi:GNAT superfamily N-acetyltransferase